MEAAGSIQIPSSIRHTGVIVSVSHAFIEFKWKPSTDFRVNQAFVINL